MNSVLPLHRLRTHFLLYAILFTSWTLKADVIYRETFGIPPTALVDAYATNFDWQRFDNNGAVIGTAAVNFNALDRPGNVTNVNAGPNSDGTFAAYTNGIFYMGASPSPSLGLTTEFIFDPTNYIAGSIVFSWYEGNNTAPQLFRLIIRQGGQWYASTQTFTTAAVLLANFGTSAELKTYTYDPTAANWVTLNFNGGYTLGGSPGTGTGTNSTLGALALGSTPASNLSGTITGFGVYGEANGGTGNRRIDTFTISATPNGSPPGPAIVASNQTVTLLMNTSTNIALKASNTNNTSLTFYISTNPASGSLGALSSNLVTYTPNSNYVGLDSFAFYASDGVFTSATATVSISVTNSEILYPSSPQITKDGTAIIITDYVMLPISSRTSGTFGELTNNMGDQLGRVNFLRSEPTNTPLSSSRFFVCDNNRNLYILSRTNNPMTTNSFISYINFEHVFPKFDNDPGYAGGLVTFQFDPEYATNGKFYTVHTEDPAKAGSAAPTNGFLPGIDFSGYTTTAVVNPPAGSVLRQGVLVEWTDTNLSNTTFEGSAREILRVGFNSNIHPMGDLLFNPLAKPGDTDYRNMYVADGDGGAGEQTDGRHGVPQRLDAIEGKILRITPDINLRPADELSANGSYRIPTTGTDTNPFVGVSLSGLRKEIFAYGFRNCHRISWDPVSNLILENDIGLHSWEEVNIIHKGVNYGYAEREGTEQLFVSSSGKTGSQLSIPFPASDTLTVTGIVGTVTPTYPVAMYSHRDGDAISSGFVYRGKLLPALYGKYIFGEITTGRIFYCDLAEMIAKDDGVRTTLATVHELQIVYNGQARRLFDIISQQYHARGGTDPDALPGSATSTGGSDIDGVPYGSGRADIRLGIDSDGELYVMSKSDAMIRRVVSVAVPPTITSTTISNNTVTLTWPSISNRIYRVQYNNSLTAGGWTNLPGDVTATSGTASKTDTFGGTNRFYRLFMP